MNIILALTIWILDHNLILFAYAHIHTHTQGEVKENGENMFVCMGMFEKHIDSPFQFENGKRACIPFSNLCKITNNRFSHILYTLYTEHHTYRIHIYMQMRGRIGRRAFVKFQNGWNICMNSIQLIKTPSSSPFPILGILFV